MPYDPLITDADVIERFEDEEALRQCFNGVPDTSAVNSTNYPKLRLAREDATADIELYAGNNYKIWRASDEVPLTIKRIACQLAIEYCWRSGTGGRACPKEVKEAAAQARTELQRIGSGKAPLGGDPETAPKKVGYIDNSDYGRRATYGSWRCSGMLGGRR